MQIYKKKCNIEIAKLKKNVILRLQNFAKL